MTTFILIIILVSLASMSAYYIGRASGIEYGITLSQDIALEAEVNAIQQKEDIIDTVIQCLDTDPSITPARKDSIRQMLENKLDLYV